MRWIEEPTFLGATVSPVQWHWRANCYDACLAACIEEHGGIDVPLVSDLCAAKCYDDSGCAALPYQTQAEYQAATGKPVQVDKVVLSCMARAANRQSCELVCAGLGNPDTCREICLTGLCTEGALLTPQGAQQATAKVGPCLTKCYADADALSNPTARVAARAACPTTCGLAQVLSQLPPEQKSPLCPGGKCGPTATPKTEPARIQRTPVWPVLLIAIVGVAALALISTRYEEQQ